MKKFILSLTVLALGLVSSTQSFALSNQIYYRDIKLPTQKVLEDQVMTAPAVAASTQILNPKFVSTSVSTVTSFLAQPDVPRNISITPNGSTANIVTGTVVVTGTDFFGVSLSENFTVTSGSGSASTGSKAFKTISSIVFPAASGAGVNYYVGYGSKLGLKRCMDKTGNLAWATLNGTYEGTRPTVAVNASISGNTVQLNSALNGTDVEVFFLQNFTCFP